MRFGKPGNDLAIEVGPGRFAMQEQDRIGRTRPLIDIGQPQWIAADERDLGIVRGKIEIGQRANATFMFL
jgi:hypothetical protein